ncbi:MAG: GerMN domain-containing protein [Limnochordia bacterium]|jgi:spore germination protein GerM|nr:GerMN domain-containing protein [Limnochordia bacterium]
MGKFRKLLVNLVVIALVFGAYAVFSYYNRGTIEENQAIIYLIESSPIDFRLVPVTRQVEGTLSPTSAVQALLNGPLPHEDLFASVPASASLLGLTVDNSLATINFSPEIARDFPGGSLMEAYLVQAIVNTLTEFPDIERVQILVDGEIVESIGGHILILQPLQRKN